MWYELLKMDIYMKCIDLYKPIFYIAIHEIRLFDFTGLPTLSNLSVIDSTNASISLSWTIPITKDTISGFYVSTVKKTYSYYFLVVSS